MLADRINRGGGEAAALDPWRALIRELATREGIQSVRFVDCRENNEWTPLFRQILAALQRNANLQGVHLSFENIRCSAEWMVPFLESTVRLSWLKLHECTSADHGADDIAAALCRNTAIEELQLLDLEPAFLLAILRGLPTNTVVKTLAFSTRTPTNHELVWQAMQHFLATTTTLQCFDLRFIAIHDFRRIFQCLTLNASINEVRLPQRILEARVVADLLRTKTNWSTLSFFEFSFPQAHHQQMLLNALLRVLRRQEQPVRSLEYKLARDEERGDYRLLDSIMEAACNSRALELFAIGDLGACDILCFEILMRRIPRLKTETLVLKSSSELLPEKVGALVRALKNNYSIRKVECALPDGFVDGPLWLDETDRAQLDALVERNKKLADWVENPTLVPRLLWPHAMRLALLASKESLYYNSLHALSGHAIDGWKGKRKRKRARYYEPSS